MKQFDVLSRFSQPFGCLCFCRFSMHIAMCQSAPAEFGRIGISLFTSHAAKLTTCPCIGAGSLKALEIHDLKSPPMLLVTQAGSSEPLNPRRDIQKTRKRRKKRESIFRGRIDSNAWHVGAHLRGCSTSWVWREERISDTQRPVHATMSSKSLTTHLTQADCVAAP